VKRAKSRTSRSNKSRSAPRARARAGSPASLAAAAAAQAALSLVLAGRSNAALRVLARSEVPELETDGRDDPGTIAARLAPLVAGEGGTGCVLFALCLRAKAFDALGLAMLADQARDAINAIAPGSGDVLPSVARGGLSVPIPEPDGPHELERAARDLHALQLSSEFAKGVQHLSRHRFWHALPHLVEVACHAPDDGVSEDGAPKERPTKARRDQDRMSGRASEDRLDTVVADACSGALLAGWVALGEVLIEGGCDRGARWLAEQALVNGLQARAKGRPVGALPDVAGALMILAFLEGDLETTLAASTLTHLEAQPEERWQGMLGAHVTLAALDVHMHALILSPGPNELRAAIPRSILESAPREGPTGLALPVPFYELALADALAREGRRDGEALARYRRALLIDPRAIRPERYIPSEIAGLDELLSRLHDRLVKTRLAIDHTAIERALRG